MLNRSISVQQNKTDAAVELCNETVRSHTADSPLSCVSLTVARSQPKRVVGSVTQSDDVCMYFLRSAYCWYAISMYIQPNPDFKLSLCSECCILSYG